MSTFLEQQTELAARGFDALSTIRLKAILNAAYTEVDSAYPWPYLEASVTGTPPLAVADLGQIDVVFDTASDDRPLELVAWRTLVDWYGDLSTTGSAFYAYIAYPSAVPTVATYPVTTSQIGVQYYRVPSEVTADPDGPAAPERFHGLYLAVASRMAAVETGADSSGWAGEADRARQTMAMALLPDQLTGQQQRVSYDAADW